MGIREDTPRDEAYPVSAPQSLDPEALDALSDLVGHESDLVAELVDAFLGEAPERLTELRSGVEEGDAALVERAAHTLKSNALTFGALALAQLSQELELVARAGDLSAAPPLVERVAAEWAGVRSLLDELRSGSAA